MIEIRQRAPCGLGFRPRHRLARNHHGNSGFEPGSSPVILQIPGRIEHGGLRSHGGMGAFLQLMVRIAQRSAGKPELGHVIFDSPLVFIGIRVNQVESDVPPAELLGDAAQLRRVLIGGRTIGAREEKNLNVPGQKP